MALPGLIRWILSAWLALSGLALCGCKENPFLQNPVALQNQVKALQQEQTTLAQKGRELQSRAETLDKDNQDLEAQLAQARQRAQLVEEQLAAVQDQLRSTSNQLAQLRVEKDTTEKKAQSLMASLERRSPATITANSSLGGTLAVFQMPGIETRRDGDVVRIELPADRLFEPGTAKVSADGARLLEAVASEIAHHYAAQRMGVEGHVAGDPSGAIPPNAQQVSLAQAAAVYDYLVARGQLSPAQLFIAGHGANHPVVSNGTSAGQARNRRVELVVFPEKAQGR
jgi:chemotaxis protein MotB